MATQQEQAVLSAASDTDLRNTAILIEGTMQRLEGDERVIYGDALERLIDEIHSRIGNVDFQRIDALYSKNNPSDRARKTYTSVLFTVHPEFGSV